MTDDHQPVEEDEFVLRRIHRSFVRAELADPVLRVALEPNKNDTTGISVYRERFVTAQDSLAALPPDKRDNYYVARLAVRDLRRFGLSVTPEPDPTGPSGHAVIPELNWAAFQSEKQHWKTILLQIAKLASQAIVLRPPQI